MILKQTVALPRPAMPPKPPIPTTPKRPPLWAAMRPYGRRRPHPRQRSFPCYLGILALSHDRAWAQRRTPTLERGTKVTPTEARQAMCGAPGSCSWSCISCSLFEQPFGRRQRVAGPPSGMAVSIVMVSPRKLGPSWKVAKMPWSARLCERANHVRPWASTRMSRKSPRPPHRL